MAMKTMAFARTRLFLISICFCTLFVLANAALVDSDGLRDDGSGGGLLEIRVSFSYVSNSYKRNNAVGTLFEQESTVMGCDAISQLSTLKQEVEAAQSPVMRRVFAILFPFSSPGWNSGAFLINDRKTSHQTPIILNDFIVLGTFYISSFVQSFFRSSLKPCSTAG